MKTRNVLPRFFSVALLAGLFGAAGAHAQSANSANPPAVPANASGTEVAPQSDPLQNAAPPVATTRANPDAPAVPTAWTAPAPPAPRAPAARRAA